MSEPTTEHEGGVPFNTLQIWLPAVPVAEPPTQAVSCVSVERAGAGHVRLNTTTSVVPPAAVATNWSGTTDAAARWYRVRAEW